MANKKISELPIVSLLSGSSASVIPVVVGSTTNQITAENFSKFMNLYAAQTGSSNTFTANQTFSSNVTIGGTLVVAGRLTAEEFHTEITTASVIYSSGSTKFGDTSNDSHEFTGSIFIGGEVLGNAGLNAFTASAGGVVNGIQAYTQSLKAAAIVSSSTQIQNYDLFALNSNLYTSTGSIKGEIAGLEAYTQSLKAQTIVSNSAQLPEIGGLEAYTASLKSVGIVSSSTQIQNYDVFALNSNLYNGTGSIKGEVAGIEAYTASLKGAAIVSSSTQVQNYDLFALNSNLYIATGSLIGITNGLMAFTAALDNTYATDAQLYQLYAATASLNTETGSIKGEIAGLESYTASLKAVGLVSSSTQITNYHIYAETSSANFFYNNQTISGSLKVRDGITGSLKGNVDGTATYAGTVNVQNSSTNQDYTLLFANAGTNGYLSIYTDSIPGLYYNPSTNRLNASASIHSIVGGITGSIMATNGVVSSSAQISNYYKFAETASANTFYGNQTFTNDVQANKFVFTDGVINTNVGGQYIIATSGNVTYLYTGTSGLNINDATNGNINVSISNVGAVQTRGKLTVGAPGNDQDIAFGGSNAKLDWAGTGAQIFYSVGALQFSSVGTTNNMILQQQAGALFNAGITGSLMATNNVVSSSAQVVNYNLFALTGSSNTFYGDQKLTGSFNITGSVYINGNNDSGFFYNGNRQFNFGQFFNTQTMSGSADTAYPMWYDTTDTAATADNMIYVKDGSKLYVKNTGVYNVQFSAQLGTTATETCEFSIWFAITGSSVANSNTDVSVNKTAGGGKTVAAWNLLTPLSSGSYVEIYYSKTTANGQIQAAGTQSTPTRPATPSIITTITQVG